MTKAFENRRRDRRLGDGQDIQVEQSGAPQGR